MKASQRYSSTLGSESDVWWNGPSRSAGKPERSHSPGGVCQFQEPGDAVVHRKGQHGPSLAREEGILRARADPAHSYRYIVQDPRDDRIPGPACSRVELDDDLRPESSGARGKADLSRRCY